MKKLTSAFAGALFIMAAGFAHADPADPATVILGNDGKFNAAPGICLMLGEENIGKCVKFIQTFYVSPPACDGNLHTDSLSCGKSEED